jgi:hypothetical protein
VATLGGHQGIAAQNVGWNGLHAGFTVWLSQSNAADEVAAEEEAAKAKQEGVEAYAQADVVVALAGWDENSARPAAEGSLRALKYLLEADKELPGQSVGLHLPFEDHTDTGWKSFNKYVQALCCQKN